MDDETCETCRFFQPCQWKKTGSGHCRRYPPSWCPEDEAEGSEVGSYFPDVHPHAWCGEYQQLAVRTPTPEKDIDP